MERITQRTGRFSVRHAPGRAAVDCEGSPVFLTALYAAMTVQLQYNHVHLQLQF
jgi:hypothetical protein